jgi:hypothetical protein
MAVLLNHVLQQRQREDAIDRFGILHFITLPPHLEQQWNQFDATVECQQLPLRPFIMWLESVTTADDYVFVQGDPGMSFAIVNWCKVSV